MNVELLNPEEVKNLYKTWGNFAKVCYDSEGDPERIGKGCARSGHTSGSRAVTMIFRITGYPRFVIDQMVRHEAGVCKNVQSFRYVSKDNFSYSIPVTIGNSIELMRKYDSFMEYAANLYDDIKQHAIDNGETEERANEQARYVLPMSTTSAVTIGFDYEALIHYMNMRLCVRTEDIHRQLANEIRKEVIKVLPDLESVLVPQCKRLMYCPEFKSCGAYPSKKQLQEYIELGKKAKEKGCKSNV